jgi:hypothetical protein
MEHWITHEQWICMAIGAGAMFTFEVVSYTIYRSIKQKFEDWARKKYAPQQQHRQQPQQQPQRPQNNNPQNNQQRPHNQNGNPNKNRPNGEHHPGHGQQAYHSGDSNHDANWQH